VIIGQLFAQVAKQARPTALCLSTIGLDRLQAPVVGVLPGLHGAQANAQVAGGLPLAAKKAIVITPQEALIEQNTDSYVPLFCPDLREQGRQVISSTSGRRYGFPQIQYLVFIRVAVTNEVMVKSLVP